MLLLSQSLQSISSRVCNHAPPEFTVNLLQSSHSFSSRVCIHAPPEFAVMLLQICIYSPLEFAVILLQSLPAWLRIPSHGWYLARGSHLEARPHSPSEFAAILLQSLQAWLCIPSHGWYLARGSHLEARPLTRRHLPALSKGVCCIQVFAISHAVVVLFSIIYRQRSYSGGTMNHNHHLKHTVRSHVLLRHRVRFCSC